MNIRKQKFEKIAKDADIAIIKVVIDHKEHQVDKAIYVFNEKANHHSITPMNTKYSYHHLTHDELTILADFIYEFIIILFITYQYEYTFND